MTRNKLIKFFILNLFINVLNNASASKEIFEQSRNDSLATFKKYKIGAESLQSFDTLEKLPLEILVQHILSYVSSNDLEQFKLTSKDNHKIITESQNSCFLRRNRIVIDSLNISNIFESIPHDVKSNRLGIALNWIPAFYKYLDQTQIHTIQYIFCEYNVEKEHIIKLFECLPKNNVRILDLNGLITGSNKLDVIISFSNALKNDHRLIKINLNNVNICHESLRYLSNALCNNNTLKKLDLQDNDIEFQGMKYLGEALKINTTLIKFNLRDNRIESEGIKYLSEALKINTTLIELNLRNNGIGPDGVNYLGEALKINSTLKKINLSINAIGNQGVLKLIENLSCADTLVSFNLKFTSTELEGSKKEIMETVEKLVESNKALKILKIGVGELIDVRNIRKSVLEKPKQR